MKGCVTGGMGKMKGACYRWDGKNEGGVLQVGWEE